MRRALCIAIVLYAACSAPPAVPIGAPTVAGVTDGRVGGGAIIGCPGLPPDPRAPRIEEAAIVAHGPLSTELVRRILYRHRESVRHCYEVGLARDPELSGSLLVDLVINESGASGHVQTWSEGLRDMSVERCIAWHVRSFAFPSETGRGAVPVSFRYELAPPLNPLGVATTSARATCY